MINKNNKNIFPLNNYFPIRKCPCCDFNKHELLFKQKFIHINMMSLIDSYNVVACDKCGFVFASEIPDQNVFEEYYRRFNKYETNFKQSNKLTGKYKYIIDPIKQLFPSKETHIIDLGCAKSEILRTLKKEGYKYLFGVDPSKKNISFLKSKGINGIQSSILEIDFKIKYDLVILNAVLEHIVDLREAIQKAINLLNDNGMLMIFVPDMNDLKRSKLLPFDEFSPEHINFFTRKTLTNIMLQYGYQEKFIFPSVYLLSVFQKNKNNNIFVISKDNEGIESVKMYIKKSIFYEKEINNKIKQYFKNPLIIWGFGAFTRRLLLYNDIKNIVAIVDSDERYNGIFFENIPIITLKKGMFDDIPILICTNERHINSIIDMIRNKIRSNNSILTLHENYKFLY